MFNFYFRKWRLMFLFYIALYCLLYMGKRFIYTQYFGFNYMEIKIFVSIVIWIFGIKLDHKTYHLVFLTKFLTKFFYYKSCLWHILNHYKMEIYKFVQWKYLFNKRSL